MRLTVSLLLGICFVAALSQAISAETIRVPEDFEDVGWALREATYGDTILVAPGKYWVQGRLRSGVKILSAEGPDSTTLWNSRWYILKLVDCDIETVVDGFTMEGKGGNTCLACTTGAPIITNNTIRDSWDGINLVECNAFMKGNTISGCNRGAQCEFSEAQFVENNFEHNVSAISIVSAAPVIARNRFFSNGKAVLIQGHSYPTIGGRLEIANDFIENSYGVFNVGYRTDGAIFTAEREVAIATHNYWGSECPRDRLFMGEVVISPWTDAAHDTLFYDCPEVPAEPESESR